MKRRLIKSCCVILTLILSSCSRTYEDDKDAGFEEGKYYNFTSYDISYCSDEYDIGVRGVAWGSDFFVSLGIGYNEQILSAEDRWFESMGKPSFKVLPTDEDGEVCVPLKELFFYDMQGNMTECIDLDEIQGFSYERPIIGIDSDDNVHAIVCNGDIETSELQYHDLAFDSNGDLISNVVLCFDQQIDVYASYYDPEGTIYLYGSDNTEYKGWIYTFSDNGMIRTRNEYNGLIRSFICMDDTIYGLGQFFDDDNTEKCGLISIENIIEGDLTPAILFPDVIYEPQSATAIGNDTAVLIYQAPYIYKYDVESDDVSVLIDFNNCNCPFIPSYFSIGEDGVLRYVGMDGLTTDRYLVTAVPTDTDPSLGREHLTLSGVGIKNDPIITNMVKTFNMNSSEYWLDIVDYSGGTQTGSDEYLNNVETYYTDFFEDIRYSHLSDGAPDIIVDPYNVFSFDEISGDQFLTDLSGYIANGQIGPFPEWYTDMISSQTVYSIFDAYQIAVLAVDNSEGKVEDYDTIDYDSYDYLSGGAGFNGISMVGMTKTDYLTFMVRLRMDEFFDTDSGEVNFDSDKFISMMEWINKNVNDNDYDNNDIGNGAYSSFYQLTDYGSLPYGVGSMTVNDLSFIGFPTESDNLVAAVPRYTFAITSDCEHPDAAWSFIELGLNEHYQEIYVRICLPVLSTVSDIISDSAYIDQPDDVRERLIAVAQLSTDSVNCICSVNEAVSKIIYEESAAYYYGDITAESVAERIQNRATLVMEENHSG